MTANVNRSRISSKRFFVGALFVAACLLILSSWVGDKIMAREAGAIWTEHYRANWLFDVHGLANQRLLDNAAHEMGDLSLDCAGPDTRTPGDLDVAMVEAVERCAMNSYITRMASENGTAFAEAAVGTLRQSGARF